MGVVMVLAPAVLMMLMVVVVVTGVVAAMVAAVCIALPLVGGSPAMAMLCRCTPVGVGMTPWPSRHHRNSTILPCLARQYHAVAATAAWLAVAVIAAILVAMA